MRLEIDVTKWEYRNFYYNITSSQSFKVFFLQIFALQDSGDIPFYLYICISVDTYGTGKVKFVVEPRRGLQPLIGSHWKFRQYRPAIIFPVNRRNCFTRVKFQYSQLSGDLSAARKQLTLRIPGAKTNVLHFDTTVCVCRCVQCSRKFTKMLKNIFVRGFVVDVSRKWTYK